MNPDDKKTKSGGRSGEAPFELSGRTILRIWTVFFLTVLFVLFLLLLWKAVPVLLLLFAGGLVAIALRFISDGLSRWSGIGPIVSLSLVLLVLVGGGTVVVLLIAPAVFDQAQDLAKNLRESVADLERAVRESEEGTAAIEWFDGLRGEGEQQVEVWSRVAAFFTTTFGAAAAFLSTLVVGLFFAFNPKLYVLGFLRLIPLPRRDRAREILGEVADTLRWWMVGQLISMVVLGLSTWLALWMLGVPLALILGLLTGVFTFVPYLGPILAVIPILLVAVVESPTLMVYALIAYLIIQGLESYVLMPIVFQKTVQLPPVLTIVAQVFLGAVFGLVGIILATPLMAAGIELVKLIYVEDVLGDSMEEPLE